MRLPRIKVPKIKLKLLFPRVLTIFSILIVVVVAYGVYRYYLHQTQISKLQVSEIQKLQQEYTALKNVDQYKRNNELQARIQAIEDTYSKTITVYQDLQDLSTQVNDVSAYDKLFAQVLDELSKQNYASAGADLKSLSDQIAAEQLKLAAVAIPANTTSSNTPPNNGYSAQTVTADTGTFLVYIIAGDLNTTRVIVDTASDSDCSNNCPTLPLATYAQRSGAYAGINGTFFCPIDYPSCAGKTGSFDTLLMNKNKVYFNSANNVYSTVPAVIFSGNSSRWVTQSLQWGRDTSVDSVIAMQPLLVLNGNIVYGSSTDTKFTNKGTRNFIATKGSTVYIGTIFNANMTDSAHVMKALGMDNALNLDEGGSTALWLNGSYLDGPGRNIPNAVLFVRK